jgi:hypothetical protein
MTWLLANWKLVLGAVLLSALSWFMYSSGENHIQQKWDKEKAEIVAQKLKDAEINAKTIHDLEVKNAKANNTIDSLAANNHALRLRLPPSCPASSSSGGSGQTTTGDGALHPDASEIIARYSTEVGREFVEADKVVEQCRVVFEWAKALPK